MLARKEEVGSKKAQAVLSREAIDGVAAAAAAASTATVTTASGHVMAVSEFVARFDEEARKRLNRMNEKLKKLETQMEAMEAEISKASELSQWD